MSWTFRFHKHVSKDISNSTSWYEKQRPGLGDAFYTETRTSLLRVKENPEIHGAIHGQIRFIRFHRFPFAIYFFLIDAEIVVLGVRHTRQNIQTIVNRKKTI
jgi:plasmid stabilization system protein ParE